MTHMRQCPGQVPGNDHVKASVRELRIFCIHDKEFTVCILLLGKNTGIFDHIRCQVDSCHLMSGLRQKDGEESCPASHIKNSKVLTFWHLCTDFLHPSLCHFTVEFLSSLLQKAVTSFFPVIHDPLFALVIRTDDSSISDHRTVSENL